MKYDSASRESNAKAASEESEVRAGKNDVFHGCSVMEKLGIMLREDKKEVSTSFIQRLDFLGKMTDSGRI